MCCTMKPEWTDTSNGCDGTFGGATSHECALPTPGNLFSSDVYIIHKTKIIRILRQRLTAKWQIFLTVSTTTQVSTTEDKPKPSTNADNKPQTTAAAPGIHLNFRKEPFKIVQIFIGK